jgi:hypothetical protein
MTLIHIKAGSFDFEAKLEQEAAPKMSGCFPPRRCK